MIQVHHLKQHHLKVAKKRCGAQVYPSGSQCLEWK